MVESGPSEETTKPKKKSKRKSADATQDPIETHEDGGDDASAVDVEVPDAPEESSPGVDQAQISILDKSSARKRKRQDKHDDLEEAYMKKLAREETKALEEAKAKKHSQNTNGGSSVNGDGIVGSEDDAHVVGLDEEEEEDVSDASEEDDDTPPPQHETLTSDANTDLAKSQRTVFLANVSTTAITSKTALKTLKSHLSSFFPSVAKPTSDQPAHSIESVRFRSTAYASAIPKKAAYAKKELMDATTKSTNAYVVYSSQVLAREAARKLNGTVVLDRHLRVDEVAHPAKTDHRRCVFIGNLGFVDDETNIDEANAAEGREKRKGNKEPGDVEEGLWRTFGKCGTVESVRVIRDSKTRVGKGIAYVQFTVRSSHLSLCILANDCF